MFFVHRIKYRRSLLEDSNPIVDSKAQRQLLQQRGAGRTRRWKLRWVLVIPLNWIKEKSLLMSLTPSAEEKNELGDVGVILKQS